MSDEKDALLIRDREIQSLKKKVEEQNQKLAQLEEIVQKQQKPSNMQSHSDEFWRDVWQKCSSDPEYVKTLVTEQKMSVFDVDENGDTLLMYAARTGAYDVAQLCINLGADIGHKNNRNWDALRYATWNGKPHVEQLLRFAAMKGNAGDELRQTANAWKKQDGIIEVIANELRTHYKDQDVQQLVQDALCTIMASVIEKKLAFSDDLLRLCLYLERAEKKNIEETSLWQSISKTCQGIIAGGNKKDWFWLKEFMLKSTIWYEQTSRSRSSHLFYKLLQMTDAQSKQQLKQLESDMDVLAAQQPVAWKELAAWSAEHEYDGARQDVVPNGVAAKFTHKQLSEQGASSSSFNAHTFYDYQEYLPQLVSLAHQVDDEFHKSAHKIFDVNTRTKKAHLTGTTGSGRIRYDRGPVKLMTRAKAKAENDYFGEQFPTSACVLDLNRCAFVFDDMATLLSALDLFVNKVRHYQSGNIIGVVRNKNTFTQFSESPDYADIKLNCLIKGKANCIIGEVQFLLQAMKSFKDRAHNLYAIQRQKEYYENSVTAAMPTLMDDRKQLFVAAGLGDVKGLYKLMVHQNKDDKFMMMMNPSYRPNESILTLLCKVDAVKGVRFLASVIPESLFVDRLFAPGNPLESSGSPVEILFGNLQFTSGQTLKYVLSLPSVQQRCAESMYIKYLILWYTFRYCDVEWIAYVASDLLKLSNQDIVDVLSHKNVKLRRYQETIVSVSMWNKNDGVLQTLTAWLGVDKFVDLLLVCDSRNVNAIENCAQRSNLQAFQYLLSFERVKQLYAREKESNHDRIFRFLYSTICEQEDDAFMDAVLEALGIKSSDVLCVTEQIRGYTGYTHFSHNYTLMNKLVKEQSVQRVQKMSALLDGNAFAALVFKNDGENVNALETAIRYNKVDTVQYLLQLDAVKVECQRNKDIMWRIVFWLTKEAEPYFNKANDVIIKMVGEALNITQETVKELQTHKIVKPESMAGFDVRHYSYWDESIPDEAVAKLTHTNSL